MRRGPHSALLAVLLHAAAFASALQATPPAPPQPDLRSTSSLVIVPALVRLASGELVPNLSAADFRLTDNGVAQKVSIEDAARQPLAIVVLMQTGASAPRQFPAYRGMRSMLEAIVGASEHKVAVVTFDSRPEEIWEFPREIDGLEDAFLHPEAGDGGAAILDAVDFAIPLLTAQAPDARRIILLLSQTYDEGSKARIEDVVRRLGESNTTVYSVTFSPEKAWLKDQFTKPLHEQPPYQLMPNQPPFLHTFSLSAPLVVALKAMRSDTAAQLATLSGGEQGRFLDRRELDRQLATLANHIPNRYVLSFHPTSSEPGFHSLTVEVLHQPSALEIRARSIYWLAGSADGK